MIPLRTCTLVEPQPIEVDSMADSLSILALGDSYTIGQSVDRDDSWPYQLTDSLKVFGYNVYETNVIARTGWTTNILKKAISNESFSHDYDLVGLLIGVNNQFQGLSIDEYRLDFDYLLQKAITLAGGKKENVFVLSIPDYTVTPTGQYYSDAGTSEEIDEFNKVNSEITANYQVDYYDVTTISRTASYDRRMIASDNLHFSGKMYTKWVQIILPSIKQHLTEEYYTSN
jgi:lysophospholipase L1-like esterase